jgi:hypothetical protein
MHVFVLICLFDLSSTCERKCATFPEEFLFNVGE